MIKKISSYTLISIVTSAIGFIATIYITRLLNPSEFAFIGIFSALAYFVTPIMSFNSVGLVGIKIIDDNKLEYENFISTFISFVLFNSLIVFTIAIFLSIFLSKYLILLLLTYFVSLTVIFIIIHNIELIQKSDIKLFGFYKIFLAFLNIFFIWIFIKQIGMSWEGRIIGIILSQIIIIVLMYFISFHSIKFYSFRFDWDSYKEFYQYGFPLVIGLGATWLMTQLDKFIVLHFFDLENLGYYSLGYTLGMSFVIINQSMVNAVAPRIYNILKDRNGKEVIFKYSLYYNIAIISLVSIAIIAFYLFGEFILGSKYINSLPIVLLVMIAAAFDGMYRIYGLIINYFKENKLTTKIDYSIVILNIILSISLIPFLGIMAPAIGTIISYISGFFFARYFAKIILIQRGVV